MVKQKTINLNSVRLNTVALNHYGNISGGGFKPDPIAVWIRKHMAFRYNAKGYTNEVLSQTKQLEDLSGNNRPMLLNNFLFAEMSGVGGYNDNFKNWRTDPNNGSVKIESDSSIVIQSVKIEYRGVLYQNSTKKTTLKCNITGITEELKGKLIFRYFDASGGKSIPLENGYFEFNPSEYGDLTNWYGITSKQPIDNCNITITQIPEYPGALVTDGVDDYGLVQNMAHGVKMLFMTVEFMNTIKYLYDQQVDSTVRTFGIYLNGIAYNVANSGKTYINGEINISTNISVNNLLKKKHIITISNNNVDETNSTQPHFFMSIPTNNYFVKSAFYNAIGFDAIPTEEDGFTEQELIDYVIEKYKLNKI